MEEYKKPAKELSGRRLKERALDLLSRRDHSERELFRKLREKGADPSELPELLEQLRSWGYLDDRRFAENFVRYRAGKAWGKKRYSQELLQRGVRAGIVEEVLNSSPELSDRALDEKLSNLVERELDRGRSPEKITASMLRRGFHAAQVREAVRRRQER